jgi:hypothetical protein
MEARLLAVIIFLVLGQRDARIDNPFAVGRILLFRNVCFCYILYKNLFFFRSALSVIMETKLHTLTRACSDIQMWVEAPGRAERVKFFWHAVLSFLLVLSRLCVFVRIIVIPVSYSIPV